MFVKIESIPFRIDVAFPLAKYWMIPRTDGVRCLRSVSVRAVISGHSYTVRSEWVHRSTVNEVCITRQLLTPCARQPHTISSALVNSLPIPKHHPCSSLLLVLIHFLCRNIDLIMPNKCIISSKSLMEFWMYLQSSWIASFFKYFSQ